MIIAITGGTGFIGKRLVRHHLDAGDGVRILTRRTATATQLDERVRVFYGDLTAAATDLVPFVDGADVVYHCAGELKRAEQMAAVHVDGTRRLVAAAGRRIGRWVQLSSVGAYGPCNGGPIDESTALQPRGIYEQTKAEADAIVETAGFRGAFAHTILRPSIVFGPDMANRSLLQWIAMISRGWFFFVGPTGASANYIFVDNVVDALVRSATLPQAAGQVYNLSDWRTVEDFVVAIAEALGRRAPSFRVPERPLRWLAHVTRGVPGLPLTESRVAALCTRTTYPCAKIVHELHYEHRVSIEEGLRRVVAQWQETPARRVA